MQNTRRNTVAILSIAPFVWLLATACSEGGARESALGTAESCMTCHNGATHDNYAGPGIPDPHPFPGAENLSCTTCHGGDPNGRDKESSHVPPPPQIGSREHQRVVPEAYFNRLTLAGIDKYADYTVNGRTWTALDYLQFVNPGDLRVVSQSRSCGACHQAHAECMSASPLATSTGILGGAMYAIGAENAVTANGGLYLDTASDFSFRAVTDPDWQLGVNSFGSVGSLIESPVFSVRNRRGPDDIFQNPDFDAANLVDDIQSDGRVVDRSPLARLFHEQVSFTCGDCHLGSAGANNRAGDFRSSGCTACHMPYSLGGRSGSGDPNVDREEPLDPDDIDEPERAHVRAHRIVSVARTLSNGVTVAGMDDLTCAGCHQGSNRTVMQYWGIRLDQNQDVRRGVQYPANPVRFTNTSRDTRLFDPEVGNRTFNGRNANQYLAFEDYDGDNRDDTPPDVHHEAGMGCIDCHGSYDLHGDVAGAKRGEITSRMDHAVAISCENCHGSTTAYALTAPGTGYDGVQRTHAVDGAGNVLKHVVREDDGTYWLTSRLTGRRHFVSQTLDTIVDNAKVNPLTGQPVYSAKASYAMGRADGNPATGIGPQQTGGVTPGFSHGDNMSCASCHSAWTNTCVGCHLGGEYNNGNNFSNITGQRIVFRQEIADFVYQSPVPFQLGVSHDNKIQQFATNTKVFFQWKDRNNQRSQVFAFSDRESRGANQATPFPSLGHNYLLAHSIRGRVTATNEGPRYCVACHLTTEGLANHGAAYDTFRTQIANHDFGNLDFAMLQTHIGRNPGNQLNSPMWVHMVAGLGSGMFLFDASGRPINPLDNDANRRPFNVAPATRFDPNLVAYDLDRVVLPSGVATASNNHAMNGGVVPTPNLRDGATDPAFSGPLGSTLVRRLTDPTTGIVLDSWLNANGANGGDAGVHIR